MIYVVREIATVEATILTYFLVEMWRNRGLFLAGFEADLADEFMMQLYAEYTQRVVGGDGEPVEPPEFEIVTVDLVPIISGNIFAYWGRAQARGDTGDHTSDWTKPGKRNGKPIKNNSRELIKRDRSDPKSVLATSEVQALLNVPIEVR
jgi:hypothetical protein